MNDAATIGGMIRMPLLVALLVATAWPNAEMHGAMTRLDLDAYWPAWAQMAIIGMVFVALMLLGRRRRQPWWLLILEGAVAGVLAFVPPGLWTLWLGVGGRFAQASRAGFMQPLAMAWLGIVLAAAVWQRQSANAVRPPATTHT